MDYMQLPFGDCLRGGEGDMLLFALERVHRQFAWKTGGLDASQLGRRHPPSAMTLAGLVKHLTFVEEGFTARALGRPLAPPWDVRDWVANDDWSWESATSDEPNDLYELWYDTVDRSHRAWRQMVTNDGLDVHVGDGDGDYVVNRRRILVDLLEENLLHTGHASLLREAVDGLTGNDPP